MNKLYFWNDWDGPYKKLYWVVFICFITTIIYTFYQYFFGIDSVIYWEVVSKLEQLKTTAHSVNIGNFRFSFPLDNYIVTQYYKGSDLSINPIYGNKPDYVIGNIHFKDLVLCMHGRIYGICCLVEP
jgi:hypothetical protein